MEYTRKSRMHSIQAILFDLDGVLVNTTYLHYETFRDALTFVKPEMTLSWEEHEQKFEGMSTRLKLKHLNEQSILTEEEGERLFEKKQELLQKRMTYYVQPNESLKLMLITLNNQGFRLFCCSNSIRKTLDAILTGLGIREFFEATYSNEDVTNPKPSPDIYQLAMSQCFLTPEKCLIVEDSLVGRTAAYASGAHVLEVEDADDVTASLLRETLYTLEKTGTLFPRTFPYGRLVVFHVVVPLFLFSTKDFQSIVDLCTPKEFPQENYHMRFHFLVGSTSSISLDKLFWDRPSNLSYTYHKVGSSATLYEATKIAEKELAWKEPVIVLEKETLLSWKPDSFYKCLLNPGYDLCVEEKVSIVGWRNGTDFVKYWTPEKAIQKGLLFRKKT